MRSLRSESAWAELRIGIDSMPAGFAMDQLVTEKILGGTSGTEKSSNRLLKVNGNPRDPWSPSKQDNAAYDVIAAAWMRFGLNFVHDQDRTGHIAHFVLSNNGQSVIRGTSRAETFALAVCRAALKAAELVKDRSGGGHAGVLFLLVGALPDSEAIANIWCGVQELLM